MNSNKKNFKFGFINIPNNMVLIHQNIFSKKPIVKSSGLRFVFGYYNLKDMSVNIEQLDDQIICNIDGDVISFDLDISFKIAGGSNADDIDRGNYYKFIEACVTEEKNIDNNEWINKYNNSELYNQRSYFKNVYKQINRKNIKKWWRENHPVLEYTKYERQIVANGVLLKDDIQVVLRELFAGKKFEDIIKLNSNSLDYKKMYFEVKKKLSIKGIQLVELYIKNIKKISDNKIEQEKKDFTLTDDDMNFSVIDSHLQTETKNFEFEEIKFENEKKEIEDLGECVINYDEIDDYTSEINNSIMNSEIPIILDNHKCHQKNTVPIIDFEQNNKQDVLELQEQEDIDSNNIDSNLKKDNQIIAEETSENNEYDFIRIIDYSINEKIVSEENNDEKEETEVEEEPLEIEKELIPEKKNNYLMIGNDVITVFNSINKNNYKLDIPSFVDGEKCRSNYEVDKPKIKVLM